jgi:TPR repeat protein
MKASIVAVILVFAVTALGADSVPDSASIAAAKLMKSRADQGDAEAMYVLGLLATHFAPRPFAKENADAPAWKALLENQTGQTWLNKSAEAGYVPAIEAVCRMGQDRLAPAALREERAAKCSELKAKFPQN